MTEKAFNFIINLGEVFKKADYKNKAIILKSIGKRIDLKYNKLIVIPNDWLKPIKEEYPTLDKEYLR